MVFGPNADPKYGERFRELEVSNPNHENRIHILHKDGTELYAYLDEVGRHFFYRHIDTSGETLEYGYMDSIYWADTYGHYSNEDGTPWEHCHCHKCNPQESIVKEIL